MITTSYYYEGSGSNNVQDLFVIMDGAGLGAAVPAPWESGRRAAHSL
jgi:hypothetical protein